jgi:repressor of nif and glnA expression
MIGQQTDDVERKTIAILKTLSESPHPLGGRMIARRLNDQGINLGERAVRYHLKMMDERGLTRIVGRRDGRSITSSGLEEVNSALVNDRVGLILTRINSIAYQSSFKTEIKSGAVPVNVSLFPAGQFNRAIDAMKNIFHTRVSLSDLVSVAAEGQSLGEIIIPPGKTGLATVSHIVVCAALMRAGIPVDCRFGGMVQMRKYLPMRFVDLIEYRGCSLDPSAMFVAGRMTSVCQAAGEGNGRILASFCEIPALALTQAQAIIHTLEAAGVNGMIKIGKISEPVCEIPVEVGKVGIMLIDGLNPIAAAVEAGVDVNNIMMSGVIDFGRLVNFRDLRY